MRLSGFRKLSRMAAPWVLGHGLAIALATPALAALEPASKSPLLQRVQREIAELEKASRDGAVRALNLARLHFYLGESLSENEPKIQSFAKGLAFAEEARKLAPGRGEAYFWGAIHRTALLQSGAKNGASFQEIEKQLLEAKRLDPSFGQGAADRALGLLYAKGPAIEIGSLRRAAESYRAALKRFPDHPGNRAYYARFLIDNRGECKEARDLARGVLRDESRAAALDPFEAPQWMEIARSVIRRSEGRCTQ